MFLFQPKIENRTNNGTKSPSLEKRNSKKLKKTENKQQQIEKVEEKEEKTQKQVFHETIKNYFLRQITKN